MTPLDSYRIDLPSSWTAIPIGSSRHFERAFAEHRGETGWALLPRTEQRRVELAIQQLDAQFNAGRCSFAGLYVEPIDEDALADGGTLSTLPLIGAVTVSTLSSDDLGVPGPVTTAMLEAAMARPVADSNDENLEAPQQVALPVSSAVRAVRLIALGDRASAKVFNQSFMVPIEPDRTRVCILSFTTPNLDAASDFETLFDAIAQTLKFYREGDPTEL